MRIRPLACLAALGAATVLALAPAAASAAPLAGTAVPNGVSAAGPNLSGINQLTSSGAADALRRAALLSRAGVS
jgi:hypothetical protein